MRLLATLLFLFALAGSACLADAAGVEPVEGGWKGETRQGLPVYFGVREGHVVNTRYQLHQPVCGVVHSHHKNAKLEIDASGHWEAQEPNSYKIEGTFVAPNRVEGKLIGEERELSSCFDVATRFVATPRHG